MLMGEMLVTVHWRHTGANDDSVLRHPQLVSLILMNGRIWHAIQYDTILAFIPWPTLSVWSVIAADNFTPAIRDESFSAMCTEPYGGRQPRHWSWNKYVTTRCI